MAIAMTELVSSQSGSIDLKTGEITRSFLMSGLPGTNDPNDINAFILANTPSSITLNSIPIDSDSAIDPDNVPTLRRVGITFAPKGLGYYEVDVKYGIDTFGAEYSFDTTGNTVHVLQSIATIDKTAVAGATAINTKNAIGITRDRVEGVDIFAGKLEFSLLVSFPTMSLTYLRTLRDLTATTNDISKDLITGATIGTGTWRGFAVGELLFLGASGSFKPDAGWTITYKFAAGKNEDITIAPGLSFVGKLAWEYLWVGYTDAIDTTSKVLVQQPTTAYLEQVYKTSNFMKLLIGS